MNGQADELIGQHSAATESGSAVVVVGDGDAGSRSHIVVGLIVEKADSPGVMVSLQMTADLVIAIPQAVWKEPAFGVQQQARGLDGATRNHNNVRELLLQTALSLK